ncbi:MAG: RNA polymerase sigma factor region1.1 domain-containing protein, partial [Deltaproteobacteria bacterium]
MKKTPRATARKTTAKKRAPAAKPTSKAIAKKAIAKKAAAKKAVAKKAVAKKAAGKKVAGKKVVAQKVVTKKTGTKKAVAAKKKAGPSSAAAKKATASKSSSAKKATATKLEIVKKSATPKKATSKKSAAGAKKGTAKSKSEARIKKLIDLGKERGYLTSEEVSKGFGKEASSSDDIDNVMTLLGDLDIEVVEQAEAGSEGPEFDSQDADENSPAGATPSRSSGLATRTRAPASTTSAAETSDPVRMYLQEMGGVPLLSREDEVTIAKQIESGENE